MLSVFTRLRSYVQAHPLMVFVLMYMYFLYFFLLFFWYDILAQRIFDVAAMLTQRISAGMESGVVQGVWEAIGHIAFYVLLIFIALSIVAIFFICAVEYVMTTRHYTLLAISLLGFLYYGVELLVQHTLYAPYVMVASIIIPVMYYALQYRYFLRVIGYIVIFIAVFVVLRIMYFIFLLPATILGWSTIELLLDVLLPVITFFLAGLFLVGLQVHKQRFAYAIKRMGTYGIVPIIASILYVLSGFFMIPSQILSIVYALCILALFHLSMRDYYEKDT
ncbi:MAG: hypothetical protein ACMXYC_02365 [Candidatus Woesearchaeota archaeon]